MKAAMSDEWDEDPDFEFSGKSSRTESTIGSVLVKLTDLHLKEVCSEFISNNTNKDFYETGEDLMAHSEKGQDFSETYAFPRMASEAVTSEQEFLPQESEEAELEPSIKFFPPAYIQRYCCVRETLSAHLKKLGPHSPQSILEVGCAEFGMHFHFKSLENIQKVIYMDLDKQLLSNKLFAVQPLPVDVLSPREHPLTIEVYAGCVTEADNRIKNSDPPLFAIVGIEILEHLDKDVEEKFVYTLFKKYAPPLVILTTPNGDFNPILGLEKGKFRHWDHRFELTRQEFEDWCEMVCHNFPQYEYYIQGIAKGPAGSEDCGCLSQMAVFERRSNCDVDFKQINEYKFENNAYRVDRQPSSTCRDSYVGKTLELFEQQESDEPYELLRSIDYPWRPKAPLRERVVNEIKFYINNYVLSSYSLEKHYEDGGGNIMSVSNSSILDVLKYKFFDEEQEWNSDILPIWLEEGGLQVVREECNSFHIDVPVPEEFTEESDLESFQEEPVVSDSNSGATAKKTESCDEEELWD